jgi:hypothetical protein
VGEFLRHRQPIHLGGMTDPFPPFELDERVTLKVLRLLADRQYPTVISTKGELFRRDEYLETLARGRFVLQLSISSLRPAVTAEIDRGTPGAARLLAAARDATSSGVPVACRIQPLLPTLEDDAYDVMAACSEVGIRHTAVEHLKLPVERAWAMRNRLSEALGSDLHRLYKDSGSRRVGREWILPVEDRLPRVLSLRDHAHRHGMTFAAADTDLLLLSDGRACCSAIDVMGPEFQTFFRYTYSEACRRGLDGRTITRDTLAEEWRPRQSVGMYVNSSSRIPGGAGIDAYYDRNWNGSTHGASPAGFYGVVAKPGSDHHGFATYELTQELKHLMADAPPPND